MDQGNVDTTAARMTLLWEPSSDFKVTLKGDYTLDKTNGTATVFGGIANSAAFVRIASFNIGQCPGMASAASSVPETATIDRRCANNAYLQLGPYQVAGEVLSRSRTEILGGSLKVEARLSDNAELVSTTAYRVTKPFSIRDADNTPLKILESLNQDTVKQFSQELTLGGELMGGKLNYLLGAYYFNETDNQFYPVYLPSLANGAGQETLVGGSSSDAYIKNESFALFTQESLAITDRLDLTAGIRYTRDVKEVTPNQVASPSVYGYTNAGYLVAYPDNLRSVCLGTDPNRATGARGLPCAGSTVTLFNSVLNRRVDSKITPMASLRYKWTPDFSTYVSYSQGYKSGGFNSRIIQPVVGPNSPTGREFLPAFDPEKVTSYEVGAKLQIGRVLRLSSAAFVAKYNDIHIVVREGVAPVVRNAGKATVKGFELEGQLSPVGGLKIDFGLGYTDFKYDSFSAQLEASQTGLAPGALGRVDLTDLQAYTPKWTAALGASYEIILPFGTLTPRVDYSHRSKTYFDAPNTEQIAQPAYDLVNASLRLAGNGDRWSITGAINNLTNKTYRVSGNSSLTASSGYAEVTYAPPRMYTVDFTYKF